MYMCTCVYVSIQCCMRARTVRVYSPHANPRRMCSLTIECVLLLQNVFSYYRMYANPHTFHLLPDRGV